MNNILEQIKNKFFNSNIKQCSQPTYMSFESDIEKKCLDYDIADIISITIYNEYEDKSNLYEGISDDEISYKVYELNDYLFPCEIIGNENNKTWEIWYKKYYKNHFIGIIPKEFNDTICDIINNHSDISGSLIITGGKYKDLVDGEVITGKDKFTVKIKLFYK